MNPTTDKDVKEDKNLKGHIIRQSLNSTKAIISPTFSPIASSSKAFHVGYNYNKKNVITYADMIHSDTMNRLKIQQKPLSEGWNII